MNLKSLNTLLDKSWPGLRDHFLKETVENALKNSLQKPFAGFAVKLNILGLSLPWNFSLAFVPTNFTWRLDPRDKPGFEDVAGRTDILLAIPRTTRDDGSAGEPWGLTIKGAIRDTLTGTTFADGVIITLADFRASLRAKPGRVGTDGRLQRDGAGATANVLIPTLNLLHDVQLSLAGTLTLAGGLSASLSLGSQPVTQKTNAATGSVDWVMPLHPDGGSLDIKKGGTTFKVREASLSVTFDTQPALRLKGDVFIGGTRVYHLDLPVPLNISTVLQLRDLPRVWGEEEKNRCPIDLTSAEFSRFEPLDLATKIDRRLLTRHNPFAHTGGRYGSPPRLLIAMDARYDWAEITELVDRGVDLGAQADDPRQPTAKPERYYGSGDAAIWTGHLLAAQAFRYAGATDGSADKKEALAQIERVLSVVELMLTIPSRFNAAGSRGLLCRAVLPDDLAARSQEWDSNGVEYTMKPDVNNTGWKNKQSEYYSDVLLTPPGGATPEIWHGKGRDTAPPSRDSHTGVLLGLLSVFRLLNGSTDTVAQGLADHAGDAIVSMVRFLIDSGWNVPTGADAITPGQDPAKIRVITTYALFYDHILATLSIAKMVEKARRRAETDNFFQKAYDDAVRDASRSGWLPVWLDSCEPINKYYKFNLHHGALGVLLWLTDERAAERGDFIAMFDLLRRATRHHRNAYFHLIYLLGQDETTRQRLLGERWGLGSVDTGSIQTPTLKDEIRYLLYEWSRRLIPARGMTGLSGLPLEISAPAELQNYRLSSINKKVQPYTGQRGTAVSTGPLPADRRFGEDLDFTWQRSPFDTGLTLEAEGAGGNSPISGQKRGDTRGGTVIEAPGVDYLLACWLARYLKVI